MVTINAKGSPTGATGTLMRGQGVGTASAFSTATYPTTAGASGNVLQSDGTNWVSTTPAGGTVIKGYLGMGTGDPADGTTYYFSTNRGFITSTTSNSALNRFYVTTNFTLQNVYAVFGVAGTLGSAQNGTFFVRVNDTSNTTVSAAVQLTATSVIASTTSLGLALTAGDFFQFGFTGPTWTTNPTTVSLAIAFSS